MERAVITSGAIIATVVCCGWLLPSHPWLFTYAIAAMVLLILLSQLDGWRRIYAVAMVTFVLAVSNQPGLVHDVFYLRYASVALLVIWTWTMKAGGEPVRVAEMSRPCRWLIRGLWAVALIGVLSTLWSIDKNTTAQQSVALVLLVALVHALMTHRWQNRSLIAGDLSVAYWVMSASFVACLAANVVHLEGTRTFLGRFQGIYSNPNTMSYLAALTIVLGWGLWRHYKHTVILLPIAPAVACIFMSESRTALATLVIAVMLVILRAGTGGVARAAFIGVLAVVGVVVVGPSLGISTPSPVVQTTDRFTQHQSGNLLNDRTEAWRGAIRLWEQQPITGYGLQAGEELFASSRQAGTLNFELDSAHSSYAQYLLELGLVGVVPLLFVLASVLWAFFRERPHGLGVGLLGVIVAGLGITFTESALLGTGQPYPYIFWLCVAGALVRTEVEQHAGAVVGDHQVAKASA